MGRGREGGRKGRGLGENGGRAAMRNGITNKLERGSSSACTPFLCPTIRTHSTQTNNGHNPSKLPYETDAPACSLLSLSTSLSSPSVLPHSPCWHGLDRSRIPAQSVGNAGRLSLPGPSWV